MTFEQYEKTFREKAEQAGYSEENIIKCLNYAKPILEKKIPVIYNTLNFSALVGYNKHYLKKAALYTPHFYRKFKIKKRNGSFRELSEPLPSLKEIQLWILHNILYKISISKFAKAYIPGRNITDSIKYHKAKEKVLNLDIENFFDSIDRLKVENVFRNLGYSSNVSNLLSKLCCCNNCLPQGAPTSPYLTNIILINFDNTVADFCKTHHIRFTRYADDLSFSGKFDEKIVEDFVKNELTNLNLGLNSEKTLVMTQNMRQVITGVVVNKVNQVPKEYRDKIRQEMYYIKKFGLDSPLKKIESSKSNYLKHLLGKVHYVLNINKDDKEMQSYRLFLKTITPKK